MTVQNPPLWLQAGTHPAEDTRNIITQVFAGREGVIKGGLLVTEKSGTANMSVDVSEGSVLIAGTEGTYQGLYLCHNRGTENLVISAADGTNPRWDLIVAKVQDSDYSGAVDSWSLAVVTGTAAASPAFPAVPDNAFVLATVAVPAADTVITNSQITNIQSGSDTDSGPGPGTTTLTNYGYASAIGGEIIVESLLPSSGIVAGQTAFSLTTGYRYRYNGTNWVVVSGLLNTFANVAFTATTSPGNTICTLTLPRGTWLIRVTGNYETAIAGTYSCFSGIYNSTPTAQALQDTTVTVGLTYNAPFAVGCKYTVSAATEDVTFKCYRSSAAGTVVANHTIMTAWAVETTL